MSSNGKPQAMVTLTIDDKELSVPKGTNLIEAAAKIGIEVPYYCYHPHLSVPGNCRICQLEVEGMPKLMIGCHTQAQNGMVVRTQHTSARVKDTLASTMELLLINHPLDCTVCDQAGHCKLQDYHFEYNAKPSRFLEQKERKVKALPLGPTVVLDAERCIACTRCVRFCDEITGTSELGMIDRGDRFTIAVFEGHELKNPLSGTVVDLCPVGALTHRGWRFNTRLWFTDEKNTICPGCSTGCNAKVAVRDKQVVQVKARLNAEVNKEWMCDEGRYGFNSWLPEERVVDPSFNGEQSSWDAALEQAKGLKNGRTLVVLSPSLMLEDYYVIRELVKSLADGSKVVLAYKERELTEVEAILISPDRAANFKGAQYLGLVQEDLIEGYQNGLKELKSGGFKNILVLDDASQFSKDSELISAVASAELSVSACCDLKGELVNKSNLVFPSKSVLERSGLFVNRGNRLQYCDRLVDAPPGSKAVWQICCLVAEKLGKKVSGVMSDRDLTIEYLASEGRLKGLKISRIKGMGICLDKYVPMAGRDEGSSRPGART